ncbi:DUF4376 domain-containing protein [Salmonella enterica subsp. enterica serovar Llandoff]|nr:DUF4376 domain-containing protein [Salmonella enterica subsp. enterica serovar Llandoff]
MTQYAYYHPTTMEVIDWIDTSFLNVILPDSVIQVTDEQCRLKDKPCWVCLDPLTFITTQPPSKFHRLQRDQWVYDAALFAATLEATKSQVIQAIKVQRDKVTADYIVIGDYHFHSDANSRIQQMSLTRMGQAKQIPKGLMWQTKNLGLLELTNEIAAQFESVTMNHDMRLFANAQHHIAVVEALEDIEEVQEYDYSGGWHP